MMTETVAKFQRELNSLQGLSIMNIVFGGLAMSFAISIVVQNVFVLTQTRSLLFPELVLTILGFVVGAVSVLWLVSSAELLEDATDMKDDYARKKAGLDEDGLTGMIVKMMAQYRENKPTIKLMMLVSRIAGVCFLISGAFGVATVFGGVTGGVPTWELLLQVLGAGLNFAMAAASLAIPHFFGKYSTVWDYRLEESVRAENELRKRLEEV
jgi:hypothetical protein